MSNPLDRFRCHGAHYCPECRPDEFPPLHIAPGEYLYLRAPEITRATHPQLRATLDGMIDT